MGANPIRYLLSRPALSGRKARWLLQLSEFYIECVTPKAIKGQVFADLLASFPSKDPFELSEEIPGEIEQNSSLKGPLVFATNEATLSLHRSGLSSKRLPPNFTP